MTNKMDINNTRKSFNSLAEELSSIVNSMKAIKGEAYHEMATSIFNLTNSYNVWDCVSSAAVDSDDSTPSIIHNLARVGSDKVTLHVAHTILTLYCKAYNKDIEIVTKELTDDLNMMFKKQSEYQGAITMAFHSDFNGKLDTIDKIMKNGEGDEPKAAS